MMEMRGRVVKNVRLQTDYASHECRASFFEHCKKSGMDVRERPKPWEQDDSTSQDAYRFVTIDIFDHLFSNVYPCSGRPKSERSDFGAFRSRSVVKVVLF